MESANYEGGKAPTRHQLTPSETSSANMSSIQFELLTKRATWKTYLFYFTLQERSIPCP